MAPISDFPPELLEEIFLSVCRDTNNLSFGHTAREWTTARTFTPNYDSPASPFSISHVNRRWRNIAINLPRLWTHLRIIQSQRHGVIRLVKEWIDRAGPLPLYLSFHSRKGLLLTNAILDYFFELMDRCLSFELDVPALEMDHLMELQSWQEPKPAHWQLEIFKVHVGQLDNLEACNCLYDFSLRSGTLLSLIWDATYRRLMEISEENLGNLTELVFLRTSIEMDGMISLLSNCTNLIRLVLSIQWTSLPSHKTIIPVTMSQLTFLSVESSYLCDYHGKHIKLFNFLIVPSLLELEIVTDSPVDFTPIVNMLERSGSRLEKLKIQVVEDMTSCFNESSFARALKFPCFQGLRELEGRGDFWTDTMDILNARVKEDDNTMNVALVDSTGDLSGTSRVMYRYLPRLEKFTLIEYEGMDFGGIVYNLEHPSDVSEA